MRGISILARPLKAVLRGGVHSPFLAGMACLLAAVFALGAALALHSGPLRAQAAANAGTLRAHMGVASCAGSTCHGRSVASGTPVRQDELLRWQEESSPTGAHSRAWRVIGEPRGQAIARRLGLDSAGVVRECAGCHASQGAAKLADGVDCEACHGASGAGAGGGWLATHYTVGTSHARNVAQGMTDLGPGEDSPFWALATEGQKAAAHVKRRRGDAPPSTLPWPSRYLVAEYITTAAP